MYDLAIRGPTLCSELMKMFLIMQARTSNRLGIKDVLCQYFILLLQTLLITERAFALNKSFTSQGEGIFLSKNRKSKFFSKLSKKYPQKYTISCAQMSKTFQMVKMTNILTFIFGGGNLDEILNVKIFYSDNAYKTCNYRNSIHKTLNSDWKNYLHQQIIQLHNQRLLHMYIYSQSDISTFLSFELFMVV